MGQKDGVGVVADSRLLLVLLEALDRRRCFLMMVPVLVNIDIASYTTTQHVNDGMQAILINQTCIHASQLSVISSLLCPLCTQRKAITI